MEHIDQVNAVQAMQDYIINHLCEPITLSELSRAAGYSPFHCARMFKEFTGKTPFEYIRAMRLTRAALKLRDEQPKVLDVALDYLFDSHEGFTRAFSREFGITPAKYSKSPPPIKLFLPTPVVDEYTFYHRDRSEPTPKPEPQSLFIQVIERPARKLILKRAAKANDYFEYCEEVDCDIWGLLCSVKEALYEPIGLWLPHRFRPEGTSYYAQGVEVPADYSGVVPDGLDLIDLPPCQMLFFQGRPFADAEFFKIIEGVSESIDAYNPEVFGFRWADDEAPRFQLEPQGYRGYIEARPVRKIS
ncbi:helix-turn-helix domain-containing protein [Acetanaerobacterium elongatum]|uniref:Transcriptional regulator, AraC family n=1 Tax=Acetanaerobacterium elongatum TaxID=258515 RepID=A0A1H0AHH8_9FIRM|nr:helix-turn-helix domain-containing protein [Acetanaerobacterium elongatum]SDN32801.1 transcriptional regulator, AraC family [Acetanaerobacterium elongatum]